MAVYMVAIIGYSIVVGLERKCLWKMLFWNASIICVAAPLLVVNPLERDAFCNICIILNVTFGIYQSFRSGDGYTDDIY